MKFFFSLILFLTTLPTFSQSDAWFTNSTKAKAYASENKVPILLVFSGSDWCKPCMILKAKILKSTEFEEFYPHRMAILYLDFPLQKKNMLPAEQKKQNEMLAEKYNKSGLFPNLVMIDINGKVLGNLVYKSQTPRLFIDQCKALMDSKK